MSVLDCNSGPVVELLRPGDLDQQREVTAPRCLTIAGLCVTWGVQQPP